MNNKRHGLRAETALRDVLNARGYLCIRSAASKLVDLVCVSPSGSVSFMEVKAVSGNVYRISRTAFQREQHLEMRKWEDRFGSVRVSFLYAIRFGDGRYEFFDLDQDTFRITEGAPLDVQFPDRSLPTTPPYSPPTEGVSCEYPARFPELHNAEVRTIGDTQRTASTSACSPSSGSSWR